MQKRANLILWMVWVLGAALIAATLDTTPDPPAVNPHGSMAKAFNLRDCTDCFRDQPSAAALPDGDHAQRISFTREDEPDRPSDFIAGTGQAADSSPPAAPGLVGKS